MSNFVKRQIDVTFNYGTGPNGDLPGENVKLTGHRASLSLALDGGQSQPASQLRIFGLPLPLIKQLVTIGPNFTERRVNRVLIEAGDEGGGMSVVHDGTINMAVANMNAAPDVALEVQSLAGLTEALRPMPVRSYKGPTDAANIMADLAGDMGLAFESNGVSVILQNPYFPGTTLLQVQRCAEAARVEYQIDRGTLSIWPHGGSRVTSQPVRVAPDSGMVGYPTFTSFGIAVRTMFKPDIELGKTVSVESELDPANGVWVVYALHHTLESRVPNGQWFTDILCSRYIG